MLLYATGDKLRAGSISSERIDLDRYTTMSGGSHIDIEQVSMLCEISGCRREFLFGHFGYRFDGSTCKQNCNCGVTEQMKCEQHVDSTIHHEATLSNDLHDAPGKLEIEYYYQKVLAESRRQQLPKREAFSRRVIKAILKEKPRNLEEFVMIRGVDNEKARRYMDLFPFDDK